MDFDGLLLIDKPKGWSSFDVVAKIRSTLGKEYLEKYGEKKKFKVGHTGTLDPLATGLMIVVVGSYCKRASEFSKLDKAYEVQMKLGETSTTGDEEGEKTTGSNFKPSDKALKDAVNKFMGEGLQTPPAYSAIKVDGKRAYKLAREGKEIKLTPRNIQIHSIFVSEYKYPYVSFKAHVSSGTYIRSLVEDIGKELGTGAYMSGLHRTQVAEFLVTDAVSPDKATSTLIKTP